MKTKKILKIGVILLILGLVIPMTATVTAKLSTTQGGAVGTWGVYKTPLNGNLFGLKTSNKFIARITYPGGTGWVVLLLNSGICGGQIKYNGDWHLINGNYDHNGEDFSASFTCEGNNGWIEATILGFSIKK